MSGLPRRGTGDEYSEPADQLSFGSHQRRYITNSTGSRHSVGLCQESEESNPASQAAAWASLGMRQSPRGDRLIVPTFGPSGKHERLNWFAKKRRRKTASHFFNSSRV